MNVKVDLGARVTGLEAELSKSLNEAVAQAQVQAMELEARKSEAVKVTSAHLKEKRALEIALKMSKAAVHELGGSARDLEAQLESLEAERDEKLGAAEAVLSGQRAAAGAAKTEHTVQVATLEVQAAATEASLKEELVVLGGTLDEDHRQEFRSLEVRARSDAEQQGRALRAEQA